MGKKRKVASSEDLSGKGVPEARGRKADPYLKLTPEEREEVRRRLVMGLLQGLAGGNLLFGRDRARDIAGVSPETEVLYYLPVEFVLAYKDLFDRALKVDGGSALGASQDRVGKDGEEQLASGIGPETQVVSGTGIFTPGPVLRDAITERPLIKDEYLEALTGMSSRDLEEERVERGMKVMLSQYPEYTGRKKEKALEKLGIKDGEQYLRGTSRPRGLRRGDTGAHDSHLKAQGGGKRHKIYTTVLSGDAFRRKEYVDQKLKELVGAMMGQGKFEKKQCGGVIGDPRGVGDPEMSIRSNCKQFLEPGWRHCPSCGTRVLRNTDRPK